MPYFLLTMKLPALTHGVSICFFGGAKSPEAEKEAFIRRAYARGILRRGINIVLMTVGQLFFKQAAIFLNQHGDLNFVSRYLFNPWFYAAISFFAVGTLTWTQILTSMKISVAYPLLSVSYILTALGAYWLFGEKLSLLNMSGILFIMIGVSLVSAK